MTTATKKGRRCDAPTAHHDFTNPNRIGLQIMGQVATAVKPDRSSTPSGDDSSWGKMNGGQSFGIIALDMDRAFAQAGFSPIETAFLQQVRETCWGTATRLGKKREEAWPDAAGCLINVSELARQMEKSRQQVSCAKRNLIKGKTLFEDQDGVLWINKNADQWFDATTGEPRLSPGLLEFCRAVQPSPSPPTQTNFEFSRKVVNPRARHLTAVFKATSDADSRSLKACPPRVSDDSAPASTTMRRGPVAYRNGREEEIPETRREAAAPAAAVVFDSGKRGKPTGATIAPGPKPLPSASASKAPPGPGANSPEAIELGAWAAQFGADAGHLARQWCDLLPADWIRLAFMRKVVGQPRRPVPVLLNLLSKILCDWMQTGVCEFIAGPSKGGPTPKPTPVIEYLRGDPNLRRLDLEGAARRRQLATANPAMPAMTPRGESHAPAAAKP